MINLGTTDILTVLFSDKHGESPYLFSRSFKQFPWCFFVCRKFAHFVSIPRYLIFWCCYKYDHFYIFLLLASVQKCSWFQMIDFEPSTLSKFTSSGNFSGDSVGFSIYTVLPSIYNELLIFLSSPYSFRVFSFLHWLGPPKYNAG